MCIHFLWLKNINIRHNKKEYLFPKFERMSSFYKIISMFNIIEIFLNHWKKAAINSSRIW